MNLVSTQSKGVEPETQKFLDTVNSNKGPQLYEMPLEEARKVFAGLQDVEVSKLPVDIEDRTIKAGANGHLDIRILRPKGATVALPVVLYTHGAG